MERDGSGWVEGWRGMRVDGWKDREGWEWMGGRMEKDEWMGGRMERDGSG